MMLNAFYPQCVSNAVNNLAFGYHRPLQELLAQEWWEVCSVPTSIGSSGFYVPKLRHCKGQNDLPGVSL
jgi:hypothetical protein